MFEISLQKAGRPHVRFEKRAEEDRAASVEQGKKVYRDRDWVIITPPGGKDVVENHAEQWLTNIRDRAQVGQYDPEWVSTFEKMYAMWKDGQEMPEDGTPLKMCTTIFSPAEIQNCLNANIRTLEQLASVNEEGMGRIGMGARALKTRAQESVNIGEGKGGAMRVEALEVENAALKQKVEDLTSIVMELREQQAMDAPRRGRPPKQQEAA
jgi:hypothetical protein